MEMQDRESSVFIAKLTEQAERYEDMVEIMKKVAQVDQELTVEERNLLSVGYKNVIGARRASWRIIASVLKDEESKGNEHHVNLIKGNLQKVEEELTIICNDLLALIEAHLIPSSNSPESFVFYYKMKGDYYRYLAEFKTGNERKAVAEQAMEAYQTATQTASTLPATHPIKLGLALNFSVFYYEILGALDRACYLAQQAFDEAIAHLRNVNGECYRDSTLILRLLRDNLTLWTTDVTDGEDDDDHGDDMANGCITSAGHQQ